jgi:sporulation-control protein spo0M
MGFFDKLKSAVSVVTGGAATVTIEFQPHVAFPGEALAVRITATAKGAAIKGDSILVDIKGMEEIRIRKGDAQGLEDDLSLSRPTLEQSFTISGPFAMGPNESKVWEGTIQLPANAQPTFDGSICDHGWGIRGRLSMFGNDPDSGFVPLRVGLRQ